MATQENALATAAVRDLDRIGVGRRRAANPSPDHGQRFRQGALRLRASIAAPAPAPAARVIFTVISHQAPSAGGAWGMKLRGYLNRTLAEGIAKVLGHSLVKANVKRRRQRGLRRDPEKRGGRDVFVIQSTPFPANDNLMELSDHHGRAAPRPAKASNRRAALFRLCPSGTANRRPHADLGQAGRQPDHRGGRQPRPHRRSARADRSRALLDIPTDNLFGPWSSTATSR